MRYFVCQACNWMLPASLHCTRIAFRGCGCVEPGYPQDQLFALLTKTTDPRGCCHLSSRYDARNKAVSLLSCSCNFSCALARPSNLAALQCGILSDGFILSKLKFMLCSQANVQVLTKKKTYTLNKIWTRLQSSQNPISYENYPFILACPHLFPPSQGVSQGQHRFGVWQIQTACRPAEESKFHR